MESINLVNMARQHLELARRVKSGRSADTVHGGSAHALRQTILALLEGHELSDHESPGEATLQVLSGRVRLTAPGGDAEVDAGELIVIPDQRHGLLAVEDSVVLLTVVSARPSN